MRAPRPVSEAAGGGGRPTATATLLLAGCLTALAALAASPAATAARAAAATPSGEDVVVARPGGEEVLGLEQCLDLARRQNPTLLAEKERLGELGGQVWQAASNGLPTLDLTGQWTRGRDPSFALDETFGGGGEGESLLPAPFDTLFGGFDFLPAPEDIPAQSFLRTSLNLHWTLNPVLVLGAVKAASAGVERQHLAISGVEHQVLESTVSAYQGVLLAAEQVAAQEAELANQRELLSIMKLRFDLGLATELDTLQAAVTAANVEPRLERARLDLLTAGSRLNAVMGRPPGSPIAVRAEQRVELAPIDTEGALALARERPDVRQQQLLVRVLKRNRQAQKAELLPYLSADGAYGYVGKTFDTLYDNGHDYWQAAVALNVPIFDGLLHRGLVKEAAASVRRAESELDGLERQAQVEVLEVLDGLTAARRNLRAATLNLARAERLEDQMKAMLEAGKRDYLSVLEAEAGRALARSNLIQARYDVLTMTAALKRAVGWSPAVALADIPGLTAMEEER